jgi:hypothetical protein
MARSGQSSIRPPVLPALAATAAVLALLLPGLARPRPAHATPAGAPWKVYMAEVRVDTLAASVGEVLPAAERALTDDHWKLSRECTAARLVTDWKQLHHPLARLLIGDVRARCVVDLRALGPARTLVRFQSGMASQSNLEANPAFAAAQLAYRSAVDNWYRDVREAVAVEKGMGPLGAATRSEDKPQ